MNDINHGFCTVFQWETLVHGIHVFFPHLSTAIATRVNTDADTDIP